MASSLLNDRSLIPMFSLPGRAGVLLEIADYKRKKNLVLFFLTAPTKDFFLKAEEAASHIREQNAEMILVVPWSVERIEAAYKENRLTFALLCDADGKVFRRFISARPDENAAGLFITDRFGDIFFQYVSGIPAELPPFDDIVRSLVFIESQCPECGGAF